MMYSPVNYRYRVFHRIPVVILLLSNALFAQYGRFSIAEEPTAPRSAAMGSAGTALAGSGFGCYNPASPAFAPLPFLSFEYGSQPGDLLKSLVETAWMFPSWFAGASLRVHTTDFIITNEQSDGPTGPISSNQVLQAAVTGGFIYGRLAAGNSLNFFQERIGDQTYHALTWCPGVLFQVIPNSLTVGASLLHYLRLDTTGSRWYKTPAAWYQTARGLPRYARAGIAWSDTLRRWTLPFTAVCDLVYSDVYERFMVPLGAEVWVLPSLAVRAGVHINHPTEIAHFGVGLRWSSLEFDFDYGIAQLVSGAETKWLFGLTYSLHMKKQETTPQPLSEPKLLHPAKKDSTALPVLQKATPAAAEPVIPVPQTPPAADSANNPSSKPDTTGSVRPDSLLNVPARAVPAEDSVSSKK